MFRLLALILSFTIGTKAFASSDDLYGQIRCGQLVNGGFDYDEDYENALKFWLLTKGESATTEAKAASHLLLPTLRKMRLRIQELEDAPLSLKSLEEFKEYFLTRSFVSKEQEYFGVTLTDQKIEMAFSVAMEFQSRALKSLKEDLSLILDQRKPRITLEMLQIFGSRLSALDRWSVYNLSFVAILGPRDPYVTQRLYVIRNPALWIQTNAVVFRSKSVRAMNQHAWLLSFSEVATGISMADKFEYWSELLFDHDGQHAAMVEGMIRAGKLHNKNTEKTFQTFGISTDTLSPFYNRLYVHLMETHWYEATRKRLKSEEEQDLLDRLFFFYWREDPERVLLGFDGFLMDITQDETLKGLLHTRLRSTCDLGSETTAKITVEGLLDEAKVLRKTYQEVLGNGLLPPQLMI